MTTIYVFPGHGSQHVGIGSGLFARFPELVAEADSILGYSIEELCLGGPTDRLADNRFAQPAVFTVSALEYLERVERRGRRPDIVAGHSLGEYTALFAAGAMDFGTGLRVVARRAQLMNNRPTGSMVSVIGIAPERIRARLDETGLSEVTFACFNSPEQTALSGPEESVRAAAELLRPDATAVFWVSPTTAPHSPCMAEAAEELGEFLRSVDFRSPEVPVVANVTARPYQTGELPSLLVRQLVEPVRWVDTVRYLEGLERPRYEEIGPGAVLTGLIEAIRAAPPDRPAGEDSREALLATAADLVREAIARKAPRLGGAMPPTTLLIDLGLSSAEMINILVELEGSLGPLPVTLFFEQSDLAGIARYLADEHRPALASLAAGKARPRPPRDQGVEEAPSIVPTARRAAAAPAALPERAIAVVGMAGRFPGAADVHALWDLLASGRSAVRELTDERWEHRRYVSEGEGQSGSTYSRWAALLSDVDRFDSFFFRISPGEAEQMDPQQRIFLETVYEALQDGGHTRQSIGRDVGVYVGAMNSDYAVLSAQGALAGACPFPYAGNYQIANRVSYFLDLRGPSLTVDTACSSSLVAVHLACEALLAGSISTAIAGGVNVLAHPARHIQYATMETLSRTGRCSTFGRDADGIVLGEGVAAFILKPLERAVADEDPIHGVIRGTWTGAEGRTNGFTVPSPEAQSAVVASALERAGVPAATIGYVEAHGTGTPLGDPIEIRGLNRALGPLDSGARAVGSVKPNIGHLEAAAGAAGLAKVMLQFRHRQLATSLYADPANPLIDFAGGSFYVPDRLVEWPRVAPDIPRRAGISSFGLGGVNAHIVVEEFAEPPVEPRRHSTAGARLFLLSARTPQALREYAARLGKWLAAERRELRDVAETLRTGREEFAERAAFVARSHRELAHALELVAGGGSADAAGVYTGTAGAGVEQATGNEPLAELARRWCRGADLSRYEPPPEERGRRVPLPTYPFADARHWVEIPDVFHYGSAVAADRAAAGRADDREPARLADRLADYLRGTAAAVIKARPDELAGNVDMNEYGFDSVLLARLSGEINRGLGLALTMTVLYEHRTLSALAAYLLTEHRHAVAVALPDTAGRPSRTEDESP